MLALCSAGNRAHSGYCPRSLPSQICHGAALTCVRLLASRGIRCLFPVAAMNWIPRHFLWLHLKSSQSFTLRKSGLSCRESRGGGGDGEETYRKAKAWLIFTLLCTVKRGFLSPVRPWLIFTKGQALILTRRGSPKSILWCTDPFHMWWGATLRKGQGLSPSHYESLEQTAEYYGGNEQHSFNQVKTPK